LRIERKLVHLLGFFIIPLSSYIRVQGCIIILFFLATIYYFSHRLELKGKRIPLLSSAFDVLDRTRGEIDFPALFYFFAIATTLISFSKEIAFASIVFLTIGDGLATIFGGVIGRTEKSVEGSLLGFIPALFIAMFFVSFERAITGFFVSIFFEILPPKIDDNLTVPICSGIAMSLV
jgi:dolichol kinase